MKNFSWSNTEKRIARAAFDRAVENEVEELIADFKRRAAAATSFEEVCEIADSLKQIRRDFEFKYDYRYSQLILVFGQLLREKRISEEDLQGLADDKLESIRGIASFEFSAR